MIRTSHDAILPSDAGTERLSLPSVTTPDSPPMAASRRATRPTERDYAMFRRHSIDFVSQAELAGEYGISQQRVSQILRNVEQWMASHPEDEEAQCLRRSTGDRWETVIGLAMRAFRRSQAQQEVVKDRTTLRGHQAEDDDALVTRTIERTVRPQYGDVRYLHAAVRAMEKQARLFPTGEAMPRVIAEVEPRSEAEAATGSDSTGKATSTEHPVEAAASDSPAAEPRNVPASMRPSVAEPPVIAASSAGGRPATAFAAAVAQFYEPHGHGSRRDRRRRERSRKRGEQRTPMLDLSPAGHDERLNVSICGPSPAG